MQEGQSIFRRAMRHIISRPMLVLFGAVASLGGVLNIVLIGLSASVSSILLLDGLQIVGKSFLVHLVPFVLGFLLAFFVILLVSGFSQTIVLKVAGAHFHEEEDPWYGALRRAADGAVPLMSLWALYYVVSAIFGVGLYHLGLLAASAVASTAVADVIAFVTIAIILVIMLLFAIVAMNASCFVAIFRMKTWKALASGFDLFAQIPIRSTGVLLLLSLIWVVASAIITVIYGVIVFICIWIAHLGVSPEHLASFISRGINGGLLITLLIGILFVTIAVLTAFGNTVWALFFLEHVSTAQLPKKSADHGAVSSVLPEAETA